MVDSQHPKTVVPLPSAEPIALPAAMLALLCAALWGGTAVAVQFTQDDWPPLGTAAIRFALGSFFVWLWCRWESQPLAIRPDQWRPILTLGLMLFCQIALFHYGLTRTSSAHGALMIGTNPVWVALIAHVALPNDRLTWLKLLGLTVAVIGVAILLFAATSPPEQSETNVHSQPATLWGDGVLLASAWLLGIKLVYTKRALSTVEPAKLLMWSNLVGTVLLLIASLVWEGTSGYRITANAVYGLMYQGVVVSGFCFMTWTLLLRRHRASQLAVFGFAQPLFGVFFGIWLRHESWGLGLIIGTLGVACGILLVTRERHINAETATAGQSLSDEQA